MAATNEPFQLIITAEIQAEIDRLEAATGAEIDDPAIAELLRKDAEEHAEVLRRSRELGNKRVYR